MLNALRASNETGQCQLTVIAGGRRAMIWMSTSSRHRETNYMYGISRERTMMSSACDYWRPTRSKMSTYVRDKRYMGARPFCHHAALNDKSPAISICWRQIGQITAPLSTDLQASCGAYSMRGREPPVGTAVQAAMNWSGLDPSSTIVKNTSRARRSTSSAFTAAFAFICCCCCCC